MANLLAMNWWALALRGLISILFGIITFAMPGLTLTWLTLLFGAYVLFDGILNLVGAYRGRQGNHWWALLMEGIIGVLAGIATFLWPQVTLVFLLYLAAGWAIVTGVLELMAAARLRRHIKGEWLLVLTGIASILFGIAILIAPLSGALVIAWWIGGYALVFGILMLALSFRLRGWARTLPVGHAPIRPI